MYQVSTGSSTKTTLLASSKIMLFKIFNGYFHYLFRYLYTANQGCIFFCLTPAGVEIHIFSPQLMKRSQNCNKKRLTIFYQQRGPPRYYKFQLEQKYEFQI